MCVLVSSKESERGGKFLVCACLVRVHNYGSI